MIDEPTHDQKVNRIIDVLLDVKYMKVQIYTAYCPHWHISEASDLFQPICGALYDPQESQIEQSIEMNDYVADDNVEVCFDCYNLTKDNPKKYGWGDESDES